MCLKRIFPTLVYSIVALFANGCGDSDIQIQKNADPLLASRPSYICIDTLDFGIEPSIPVRADAPICISVDVHHAHCSNPQNIALGSDSDGYVRITLHEGNKTLAIAQKGFKIEPDAAQINDLYHHLVTEIGWE